MSARRVAARVRGTVQGVGFRPFAFRLASGLGLAGFVRNDGQGVEIEVEGEEAPLAEFLRRLRAEAPPLAAVESVATEPLAPSGERGFRILGSGIAAGAAAPVPPDVATCAACLAELLDPADRRHRYPFLNCTECGPRFTIVRSLPYDRATTTMAGFEMCAACRAEYEDPGDRRFHAEPIACPDCGPRAELAGVDGEPLVAERFREMCGRTLPRDAVAAAAAMLAAGAIVAVKGLGGYHLACRADDGAAVAELRRRKQRESRPFALLARDLAAARELVELGGVEEDLLRGPERPIVLARRRPGATVAPAVAPGCADLGVMLPHSPLHHLLVADAGGPLVMTSGNVAGEPIARGDEEALERLGSVADAFLRHDREIAVRAEDSVVRALDPALRAAPLMVRRARGYVPCAIPLSPPSPRPLLACGAELKSTFCLAAGARAWVGPHGGDLGSLEALRAFRHGIEHFEALLELEPELVAHDLHPDYLSTRYALEREGVETVAVQHHHAHLAACLAEHGFAGPAVGAVFDGSGYGTDGTVWGGELLVGDAGGCERAGHLLPVPLPGGDAAVREPWRMACAWLCAALDEEAPALPPDPRRRVETVPAIPPGLLGQVGGGDWEAVAALLASEIPGVTTSAGRLFDAVAALCGLRPRVGHEAQAAMELEALADRSDRGAYELPVLKVIGGPDVEVWGAMRPKPQQQTGDRLILDPRPAIRRLLADQAAGVPTEILSARFHNGLAEASAALCLRIAGERNLDAAVLSGGVFQNRLLLERTAERLRDAGLRVLIPERLPPNDGGISYGQAAVAAARCA